MEQPERWLFVSDVDDTLLGDEGGLVGLAEALQTTPNRITLAYNSSRPCASLRQTLLETTHLPMPDYLIGALGTEIQHGVSAEAITDYNHYLGANWQRERICALVEPMGFIAHPDEFQTPHKVSYTVPDEAAYHQLQEQLIQAGLQAKLIYSGAGNLDIIPLQSGKGNVIRYLAGTLNIDLQHVVVAGDSGNDVDMFVPPFRGIVVGNAEPVLKQLQSEHIYHAQAHHAWGVLEGLRFWEVLS